MGQQAKCMFVSVCALTSGGLWPATADAQQTTEVKEKAPMYSYIANWEVSRDKFSDMESQLGKNKALMGKQLSDGALIGFGNDINLVHRDGESTRHIWWSVHVMGRSHEGSPGHQDRGHRRCPRLTSATYK